MRTAEACHIPGDCLAKGIVLRRNGGYALAVLPASHHIHLPDLRLQFGDDISLASEDEISQLFLGACLSNRRISLGDEMRVGFCLCP